MKLEEDIIVPIFSRLFVVNSKLHQHQDNITLFGLKYANQLSLFKKKIKIKIKIKTLSKTGEKTRRKIFQQQRRQQQAIRQPGFGGLHTTMMARAMTITMRIPEILNPPSSFEQQGFSIFQDLNTQKVNGASLLCAFFFTKHI